MNLQKDDDLRESVEPVRVKTIPVLVMFESSRKHLICEASLLLIIRAMATACASSRISEQTSRDNPSAMVDGSPGHDD